MSDEKYDIPDELAKLMIDSMALEELRDRALKSPFG